MDQPLPANITVIGPGLLGGSLLLALRQRHPKAALRAWVRRTESIAEIRQIDPAIEASSDLEASVAGAGLIVLCTPVPAMADLARQLAALPLEKNCVISDVGSVKGSIVTALEAILARSGAAFVGSHPMAGSERSGISAARASLFEGAACIVTPTLFTPDAALGLVRRLWASVGGRVLELSPEEHDRKIARVSHLPHLAAAAVTLAALRQDPSAAACAGNGFRDVTRIASGDPALWTGIIAENRAEIVAALQDVHEVTGELLASVRGGDDHALARLLREARNLRDGAFVP